MPQFEMAEKSAGQKHLDALLDLHRTGVPFDDSVKYPKDLKSYRAAVQADKRMIELMPLNNLHRDAISICSRSEWLAEQCTPPTFPVFEGTQLLQDLEVVAGKPGSESACLASALGLAQTCLGKVSTALLVSLPQSEVSILRGRQEAIRLFIQERTLRDRVTGLYTELAATERYFLPVLNADEKFKNQKFFSGFLLLELPFIRKLKERPLIGTVNDWFDVAFDIGWLASLCYGSYRLGCYAYYAARHQKSNADVRGHLLSKKEAKLVHKSKNWMSYDTKFLWKMSDSPNWQAFLALFAGGFAAYWAKWRIEWMVGNFLAQHLRWHGVSQVATAYRVMRRVYEATADEPAIRSLPDCAPVYDFFEKKIGEDTKLAELCHLLEGIPLDSKKGSFAFYGYVDRAQDLLKEKVGAFADLAIGIGRIEAYCGLAQKMEELAAGNGNHYVFATYASDNEPAVFKVDGLWNPFLAADKAVASDIALGGDSPVRNYLITGPNAGGKSTIEKGTAIAALLGQTAGVVPAQSCHMSIFSVIETYMNITDDLQQSNSLFKKEVMRAADLLRRAGEAHGKPVLLVFDEMFNGTTPYEGISCAHATAKHIAQMPGVLSCIATHFSYLTQLSKQYTSVANKCVRLDRAFGGKGYVRTYRLHDGIADQHVALDMLSEQGVHNGVIEDARAVLADIERNGIAGV
ncbi:MAG: mismatch repair protein MutS [Candidatus Dependentiae bacterium]|nr:mismatch repair protein MutS [Candidatus Dependentiae bacterium]